MRVSPPVLALLLLLNGLLLRGWRAAEAERAALLNQKEELLDESARRSTVRKQESQVEVLLDRASGKMTGERIDLAILRERLIGLERGLGLERFSLDFRPAQSLPAGTGGGRIQASFGGMFDGIYDYLARVEDSRLALVPEEMSLRSGTDGETLLTVRWNAFWSLGETNLHDFSSEEVELLEAWLDVEPSKSPGRDPFSRLTPPPAEATEVREEAEERVEDADRVEPEAPEPPVATPQLRGFILARPELEADVSRRVLAALRFEGELRIVQVGDVLGGFRVERIDPRESVLLVNEETGERITLQLP
jgi:hypothetical protein